MCVCVCVCVCVYLKNKKFRNSNGNEILFKNFLFLNKNTYFALQAYFVLNSRALIFFGYSHSLFSLYIYIYIYIYIRIFKT